MLTILFSTGTLGAGGQGGLAGATVGGYGDAGAGGMSGGIPGGEYFTFYQHTHV